MPDDGPEDRKDHQIGYGTPPAATRFARSSRANPRGRPHGPPSLAVILQRALDAPAVDTTGKRRRISKRELMIRGLVERAAGADLAATKLLFEMLRKADPPAVASDPATALPLGEDALALLKERLARLARAQIEDQAGASAARPTPADPVVAPDAANPADADDAKAT